MKVVVINKTNWNVITFTGVSNIAVSGSNIVITYANGGSNSTATYLSSSYLVRIMEN